MVADLSSMELHNDVLFSDSWKMPSLQVLNLAHNKFGIDRRLDDTTFQFLPQLKLVNLSLNYLDALSSTIMSRVEKLQILDLSYNRMTISAANEVIHFNRQHQNARVYLRGNLFICRCNQTDEVLRLQHQLRFIEDGALLTCWLDGEDVAIASLNMTEVCRQKMLVKGSRPDRL